jgi:hypothetical protein
MKNKKNKKERYDFSWIYRDLSFLNENSKMKILKKELDEVKAEERFIKRVLNKLSGK